MTDLINALATWRISHLLVYEPAPFSLASKLRRAAGVRYDVNSNAFSDTELGKLFACVWCMSVHVGWLVALLSRRRRWWLVGLAYSAVAIIVEKVVSK